MWFHNLKKNLPPQYFWVISLNSIKVNILSTITYQVIKFEMFIIFVILIIMEVWSFNISGLINKNEEPCIDDNLYRWTRFRYYSFYFSILSKQFLLFPLKNRFVCMFIKIFIYFHVFQTSTLNNIRRLANELCFVVKKAQLISFIL